MSVRPTLATRATGPAALVVAVLALLLAVGGTSFAATALAKNTVGTKQLKNNAVVAAKVRDGSLTAADFAAGQLPAGAKGAPGATGPAGPVGAPGVSDYTIVTGPFVTAAAGASDSSTATCTGGRRPIGGGGGSFADDIAIALSAPTDADGQILTTKTRDSWTVHVENNSAANRSFFSYAVCAKVS